MRAKAETTSTQFLRWRCIIDKEWNQHTKLDHYLAHACLLLHQLKFILGGKCEAKLSDFFMKFTDGSSSPVEMTEEDMAELQMAQGMALKSSIMAAFGMDPNGAPVVAPPPSPGPPLPPSK